MILESGLKTDDFKNGSTCGARRAEKQLNDERFPELLLSSSRSHSDWKETDDHVKRKGQGRFDCTEFPYENS